MYRIHLWFVVVRSINYSLWEMPVHGQTVTHNLNWWSGGGKFDGVKGTHLVEWRVAIVSQARPSHSAVFSSVRINTRGEGLAHCQYLFGSMIA